MDPKDNRFEASSYTFSDVECVTDIKAVGRIYDNHDSNNDYEKESIQ